MQPHMQFSIALKSYSFCWHFIVYGHEGEKHCQDEGPSIEVLGDVFFITQSSVAKHSSLPGGIMVVQFCHSSNPLFLKGLGQLLVCPFHLGIFPKL